MSATRLRRTRRPDEGVAMVEFALVGVLLVMLALGIVAFGLILSFDQDLTRSAAEGARVGAVADPPITAPAAQTDDTRYLATLAATEDAIDSTGQTCGVDGMSCTVIIHNCGEVPVAGSVTYWDDGNDDCVTVEVVYDYAGFPFLPDPPLLSAAMPDSLTAKSVARLNE